MKSAKIGTTLEKGKEITYDLPTLTQHAVVLGTTGSGKTVMCKVVIEEALAQGIPVIAIDPKGDIGGLGVVNESFDFRPFATEAEKVQSMYAAQHHKLNSAIVKKLVKTETKIFTPKSHVGVQVSLLPDLAAPKSFKEELEKNPSIAASLVDPLSESLCQLAEISNNYEKAKSLISSIIINAWNSGKDLSIEEMIKQIIQPPFTQVGSLELDEFLKEQERRKIAASINLILSSPSKQAWKAGKKIDVASMFESGKLSVFDLRHTGTLEEKQYAVEQLLQEIYRFLLNKGGTETLRYILYIDEIAGLLPPPPANPPCKKSLEVLIRQGRAFGLGVVLATQNPGDIDYKMLGNIGTRFIGKLRTDNDIEKVATALGISPSTLKQELISFKTGDFFYNNSVSNKSSTMHTRWLYSYHSGPLQDQEIKWINNPESRPVLESELKRQAQVSEKVSKYTPKVSHKSATTLKSLVSQAAKYSDSARAFITQSSSGNYLPLLSITIEPRPFKKKQFQPLGPYVFNLTKKKDFDKTKVNSTEWKPIRNQFYTILKPNNSIKKAIYSAIKDSQSKLKSKLYKSTVIDAMSEDKENIVQFNYNSMSDTLASAKLALIERSRRKNEKTMKLLAENDKKIRAYQNRVRAIKAGRFMKKLFGNKRLSDKTIEIKSLEGIIRKLKRKGDSIENVIKKNKEYTKEKIKDMESVLYQKSHTLTKKLSYNPQRSDLIVRTSVLLFPVD